MAISYVTNRPIPGEIWIARYGNPMLSEVFKSRPFLVIAPLHSTDFQQPHFTVIPFTTRVRTYKYWLEVTPSDRNGLTKTSWAACNQIITSKKQDLLERIGLIDIEDWYRVRGFLSDYLGFR